jgi:hypothetical protein
MIGPFCPWLKPEGNVGDIEGGQWAAGGTEESFVSVSSYMEHGDSIPASIDRLPVIKAAVKLQYLRYFDSNKGAAAQNDPETLEPNVTMELLGCLAVKVFELASCY